MKNFIIGLALLIGALGLTGCEDPERVSVFEAQICLDKLDQNQSVAAVTAAAEACAAKVSGQNNQQAFMIRCSADFLRGGLTTAKFITAHTALGDQAKNEAAYMVNLAVTVSATKSVNKGISSDMQSNCKAAGVAGLVWIAGLVNVGTLLVNLEAGTPSCGNPTTCGSSDVQNLLNDCKTGGDGDCDPATLAEIGATATAMNSIYCGDNASTNSAVCATLSTALAGGGGDQAIGQAMIDAMNE